MCEAFGWTARVFVFPSDEFESDIEFCLSNGSGLQVTAGLQSALGVTVAR